MNESLIARVINHYYPDWEPPRDTGYTWIKSLCPFHAEDNPSASISYRHNAFKCHACGIGSSAVGIIKIRERVSYAEAKRIAEEIAPGSDVVISPGVTGQPRRRVYGEAGIRIPQHPAESGQIHVGVRGRATPWT